MKNSDQIDGWFNYAETFDLLIDSIPEQGSFLEGGAWLGKSSAYLCDKIQSSSKNINVFILDTWKGSKNELSTGQRLATTTDIYDIFLDNMGDRKFTPLRMSSIEAAKEFENESLDVVFIDMGHTYEEVKQDIEAWYPKVKNNGHIAGHDYGHPPVDQAVHEKFTSFSKGSGNCWIVHKTEGVYND